MRLIESARMAEERKLVSILFADVTGSTALGESLDLEDLRALMGRYYEHARRVIPEHGGTLEKFIGDAVMAVFGMPTAHGNDAERALAAALALRAAVDGDSVLGGRLVLRIGVNTGNVIATTEAARGEFLVTGDAVNVAARLEQGAAPGEILASERTAAAGQAGFFFAEVRAIEARGKSQPLRVFPLAGPRPVRQIGHPPLVGRKPDLAQLALLRDRALAERRPQLVSIVAPAGTGKTRLLEEFLARLPARQGFRVATARCLPYGQDLTYWPLRGLLDELLGERFTPMAVADAFAAGGLAAEDADRLTGLVLATLGIEPEGELEREAVFGAWRLLIEFLAQQAPRVVVFEDLHWASDSLLDLVEYIMQPRTTAALLIVATSRPELLDRRPGWGGGRRSFTALALEPLSDTQTATLVGKLAKQMLATTREQIVARSGGNPFFAIELARTLLGRDGAGDGAEAGADTLPDTVQEALQEQMDLLSARERAALQAAAVAGRTFRPATLQAVLAAPGAHDSAADLAVALDDLQARDLIAPSEGGAYTFRHILIRDVAYGTLARGERVRMHTAVAEWLEDFAAGRLDEFAELIAYHYREAALLARQSAVTLGAPVDTHRAVAFLERAADAASRANAFIAASEHLRHAIELAPESEQARLYELLGDSLPWTADQAAVAYHRALDCWRAVNADMEAGMEAGGRQPDPLTGARLLRKILSVRLRRLAHPRLSHTEMAALRDEAWRLAELANDDDERWRLRGVELFWSHWRNEAVAEEEAPAQMAHGLAAAAYFEARGDWEAFSEALDGYSSVAKDIGDYAAMTSASQRRLTALTLPLYERGDALHMLLWSRYDAGDYAEVLRIAREALAQRRPGEPALLLAHVADWASVSAYVAGRWSELTPFAALADEAWDELGHEGGSTYPDDTFAISMLVALAHEDQATAERAAAALRQINVNLKMAESYTIACLRDDPTPLLTALQSGATTMASYLFTDLMISFLNECGAILPATQFDLLEAHPMARHRHCLRHVLQISRVLATGDDNQLARAIDDAEEHGLVVHAARMRIVLARRSGGRAQLERARPVLERLGDRQFLRKLEEVEAGLG